MKNTILLLAGLALLSIKGQAQTVTDYDGNTYNTVNIGTQLWLKENLKVTHYRNGDEIPLVSDGASWMGQTEGARCYYDNDSLAYSGLYGALYNWYTTVDSRNLCPEYWRVPTDQEWTTLINFAGGSPIADTMLCEGCTLGFDALLGGLRSGISGDFANITNFAYFWSSTEESTPNAWSYGGFRKTAPQMNNRDYNPKISGLSIRCINDSTTGTGKINMNDNINIYPNPANDNINIDIEEEACIEILNIQGQIVFNESLTTKINNLDISRLNSGVYILRIKADRGVTLRKLIKQ